MIEEKPLKLSQIAKDLDLAVQEVSRQLARLVKVKIVSKNTEGSYTVSPPREKPVEAVTRFSVSLKERRVL